MNDKSEKIKQDFENFIVKQQKLKALNNSLLREIDIISKISQTGYINSIEINRDSIDNISRPTLLIITNMMLLDLKKRQKEVELEIMKLL